MAEFVRPTKKQRELLEFIDGFIRQHNYSPSYREIMGGLNYTSVATVALHVNNLIKRGHLVRREGKARSLEIVQRGKAAPEAAAEPVETPESWLVAQTAAHIKKAEDAGEVTAEHLGNIETLLEALSILDIDTDGYDFDARFDALRS